MTDRQELHHQHAVTARKFVAASFTLQRLGDVLLVAYSFAQENSLPLLRGLAIGSAISTVTLTIGVWKRYRWARYLLTALNWVTIAVFSFVLLHWFSSTEEATSVPAIVLGGGVLSHIAATVILVRSRRVRHYANK